VDGGRCGGEEEEEGEEPKKKRRCIDITKGKGFRKKIN
jgi:hypothetical protein